MAKTIGTVSLGNQAGVSSASGFSKGGSARSGGTMGTGSAPSGGSGQVRQGGTMPSTTTGDVPDPGRYLGPKSSRGQVITPKNRGGGVR